MWNQDGRCVPDNEFCHAAIFSNAPEAGDQLALHVAHCANSLLLLAPGRCRPTIIPQYQAGDFFEIAAI